MDFEKAQEDCVAGADGRKHRGDPRTGNVTGEMTDRATEPDDVKRAGLRQMKRVATGLLLAATVLFVVTRFFEDEGSWVGYVEAFAEAAMVGALADWFAVTALFRHPLRLPIPHTAIIAKRKDQIGKSLGEFVQGEFLTAEVINDRLRGFGVARRLGGWLAEEDNAARGAEALGDALRAGLEVLDDADVQRSVEQLVERRVREIDVAPLVGRAMELAIEGGHHQRLLESTMVAVSNFLEDNRSVLRDKLARESPWWVPEPVDDRVFAKIVNGVQSFIVEVRRDPDHELRGILDRRVLDFAGRLRNDPELLAKGEALIDEALAHPDVRAWLASLWGELRTGLERASADEHSELRLRMTSGLQRFGNRLCEDPALTAKLDRWVEQAVAHVAERYRGEVAELISSTVERWDAAATSDKLELQVGRDLQFIRINGTLVGGLAGVLIFSVGQLIG